jgi:hypothetical protein
MSPFATSISKMRRFLSELTHEELRLDKLPRDREDRELYDRYVHLEIESNIDGYYDIIDPDSLAIKSGAIKRVTHINKFSAYLMLFLADGRLDKMFLGRFYMGQPVFSNVNYLSAVGQFSEPIFWGEDWRTIYPLSPMFRIIPLDFNYRYNAFRLGTSVQNYGKALGLNLTPYFYLLSSKIKAESNHVDCNIKCLEISAEIIREQSIDNFIGQWGPWE